MALSRTPFFQLPFPDPTTAYDDLPQAVRDAWVGWAKANDVGWVDYHRIIRPTRDAYEAILSSDAAQHGAPSLLTYPPEAVPAPSQALAQLIGDATIGDIISLRTARLITADCSFLIWATASNAVPSDIDAPGNLFVGTFPCPAGTPMNTYLENIGAGYVAQFGSLATKLGESLVLWAFSCIGGNLSYVGAWTLPVKVLAALGTQGYFPLSEFTGLRRSIAQPITLTADINVGWAPGILDGAALFNSSASGSLLSPVDETMALPDASWTINVWVYLDTPGYAGDVASKQSVDYPSGYQWRLFCLGDATGFAIQQLTASHSISLDDSPLGAPGTGAWHMITARYNAGTQDLTIYRDDAYGATLNTPLDYLSKTGLFAVGGLPLVGSAVPGRVCELALWNRELTTGELTALWNSGLALRYPYG